MPPFESSPEYEHGLPEAMGVLLVNLGSPDAPTEDAVRRFLRQFLSDPRVVEIPRLIWLSILHGYILRTRPAQTAEAYQKIWTEHGSPLLLHCGHVAEAIQEKLSARLSGAIHVELAMSYGQPSIESAIKNLHSQFVRRIIVLPMYPQYSGSTTGSVFEAVSKALARRRWIPELRFVNHYHDASGYIAALTSSIRNYRELHGSGEKLLFSFHGIPEKMLLDGDPYHCQCHKTARLVSESLELADDEWDVSFQSRLGRAKWLQPYTDATLEKWGKERIGIIDVISPGFSVDCLETLEEIEIRYNKLYRDAGGGDLHYVPALNAREDHIGFLSRLIEKNVAGWPESSTDWSVSDAARKLEKSRQRAAAMGAEN